MKESNNIRNLTILKDFDRNSTIISNTELQVLEISTEDLATIYSSTIKSECEKNAFFKKICRFFAGNAANLDRTSIIEFQNCFKEVNYNRGKHVFQQGDLIDKIYVIKEGDVLLYKECNNKNSQTLDTKKEINNINILGILEAQKQKSSEFDLKNNKDLIGIVSTHDFFGEEILWNDSLTHRNYTVEVIAQPTIIYEANLEIIKRKNYIFNN